MDWCYMYKCNGESVDHLFLHCPVATELWAMVLGLFGVNWVMPKFVVEILACWQGQFGHHCNGHIWIVFPHYLMCVNCMCFEDNEGSLSNLKLFFFRTLLDWLSVWRNQFLSSIPNLLYLCNFCIWLYTPIHTLCTWVFLFFISIHLYYWSKKKKKTTTTTQHEYLRTRKLKIKNLGVST